MSSDEHGFVVKIDISGNIQIFLQEKYYNKTCGLCGNFNKFAEDDFRTQEGKTKTNCLYCDVLTLCAPDFMGHSMMILLIQQNISTKPVRYLILMS